VAGVDEAGRGPLAGPVVAAAVILPPDFDPAGIADSKKLSPAAREEAEARIRCEAIAVGVGVVEAEEIDRINILRATHRAMRLAVDALDPAPDCVLVDGLPVPGLHEDCEALVKGDGRCLSIAAASIVAKVFRDRLLCAYDRVYPPYGFARHKGYPAPEHLRALDLHGPCPIHRRSFAPVARRLGPGHPLVGAGGVEAAGIDEGGGITVVAPAGDDHARAAGGMDKGVVASMDPDVGDAVGGLAEKDEIAGGEVLAIHGNEARVGALEAGVTAQDQAGEPEA
jgi:ribonuclease HII